MRLSMRADSATGGGVEAHEPFDRALRRIRRDRAAYMFARVAPLRAALIDEVAARLALAGRRFGRALDLGCFDGALGRALPADHVVSLDAGFAFARAAGGVQADEDRLPFARHSFDLVASAGALQSVNDLPGLFAQTRRMLAPGGLLIAAFVGGETLLTLRRALIEAEDALAGGVTPRLHPMVDPREAAGLLQRAGFADPVADIDSLRLRYREFGGLVRDLRAAAETNLLTERAPLSRALWAAVAAGFAAVAEVDGRIGVTAQILYVQGRT